MIPGKLGARIFLRGEVPLQAKLRRAGLGNKDGRTAALIVLIAIGIIIVPTYLLGVAMVDSVENAMTIQWNAHWREIEPKSNCH